MYCVIAVLLAMRQLQLRRCITHVLLNLKEGTFMFDYRIAVLLAIITLLSSTHSQIDGLNTKLLALLYCLTAVLLATNA